MAGYYRQKALRAKELYEKGLPFVKVYAPVRNGDKFIVLEKERDGKIIYDIAGGGVDEGETLEIALLRELEEELNVKAKIIKKLGVYDKMYREWELDGQKFSIRYEIHVFDTVLEKRRKGKIGLKGEFSGKTKVVEVDRKTLLAEVAEFRDFGIGID